jgi:hypothetical protein
LFKREAELLKDKKHRRIFESLVNILGVENVSDDPSIMLAYSRDWMPDSTIMSH